MSRYRFIMVVLFLVTVVGAGCLSSTTPEPPDFGTLAERDGQYRITYNVTGVSADLDLTVYSTASWQRKELTMSLYNRSSTLSRYEHRDSGESFFCETGGSFNGSDCRFGASYALFYPIMVTDVAALAGANTSFLGMDTVQERECARYEVRVTADQIYGAITTGDGSSVSDGAATGEVCVDTAQGYVAELNISDIGGSGQLAMRAVSHTAEVDAAGPDVDLVMQLSCADNVGHRVRLLPVRQDGAATVTVNGESREVDLERLEPATEEIRSLLRDGTNTVTVTIGDTEMTRTCRYIER